MKRALFNKKVCFSLRIFSYVSTVLSLTFLLAIIVYVLVNGVDKITPSLFNVDDKAGPTILPALVGTLELILISLAIAVPLGVGSAIFLSEYANRNSKAVKVIRVATETLAGIPSIVYGLFGYLVFVVALKTGYNILCGGITLAIMIIPLIVRSTEESLLSVPNGLREGALALGASKYKTIFKVVLPSAASGIVTSIILAAGRVISESAVLILTIGMVVNKIPASLTSPGTSLALDIYYFASHGYSKEAAATAVILMALVLVINLSAYLIGRKVKKKTGAF